MVVILKSHVSSKKTRWGIGFASSRIWPSLLYYTSQKQAHRVGVKKKSFSSKGDKMTWEKLQHLLFPGRLCTNSSSVLPNCILTSDLPNWHNHHRQKGQDLKPVPSWSSSESRFTQIQFGENQRDAGEWRKKKKDAKMLSGLRFPVTPKTF